MKYVHSQHVIQLDLEPWNILISVDWRAQIADFGTSRFENENAKLAPKSGTVHYAAPEFVNENATCTTKADVFSFGFVLCEILFGRPVFPVSLSPFGITHALRDKAMPPILDSSGSYMP
jgi:mitogen-activated protein kinase 15